MKTDHAGLSAAQSSVAGVAWPPLLAGEAANLAALLCHREIAPIRQFQFIQRERESIKVRLVSDAPLSPDQERRIGDRIRLALDFPFKLDFTYFAEQIPRGAGGKFEEFICALA